MEAITKEQAIEYWYKFANSSRVKTNGYYTHAPYNYRLTIISFDRELISISLFLNTLYFMNQEFILTDEEKEPLEYAYNNRNKEFTLSLYDIDNLLK